VGEFEVAISGGVWVAIGDITPNLRLDLIANAQAELASVAK
jgi:hypothetical protein